MAKEGSTISGFADAFAQAISYALQYGVPLQALVDKFSHVRFEPSGMTRNPEIRFAKSIVDYIFRWLASKFLSPEAQFHAGVNGRELDETAHASRRRPAAERDAPAAAAPQAGRGARSPYSTIQNQEDAPPCSTCGSIMIRSGACYKCSNCGNTSRLRVVIGLTGVRPYGFSRRALASDFSRTTTSRPQKADLRVRLLFVPRPSTIPGV